MRKSERERAFTLFGEVYGQTGDYRAAAEKAGVSLRTGRRWRAEADKQRGGGSPGPGRRSEAWADPPLFGRSRELDLIDKGFDRGRLVTLHGATGIGKTRLATRCAERRTARGGEVGWQGCRIDDVHHIDALLRAMAQALTLRLSVGDASRGVEIVGREIASRGRTLWLLDGVDHAVDCVYPALKHWLALAPEAHFLVTSTARLDLRGLEGQALAIDPLAVPSAPDLPWAEICVLPSVRLILHHREQTDVETPPPATEQRAIAEVAALLCGIPLAIELATAAAARQQISGLFAGIGAHPAIHAAELPNADQSPQLVAGVIDWTLSTLPPAARAALAQLTVFSHGFTADDAENVISLEHLTSAPKVRAALADLRSRRLVRDIAFPDTTARLCIPPAIRSRARADLAGDFDREQVLTRHAARWLGSGDGGSAQSACDAENLCAVHRRALARQQVTAADAQRAADAALALANLPGPGLPSYQKLELLDSTLAVMASVQGGDSTRARARVARAQVLLELEDNDAAISELEGAVELSRAASDRATEAHALASLASIELLEMQLDSAGRHLEAAHSAARAAGDDLAAARAANAQGIECTTRADNAAARGHIENALVLQRKAGGGEGVAHSLAAMAGLCHAEPYHDLARGYYAAARSIYAHLGDRVREAQVVGSLGLVEHTAGRLRAANDSYRAASELCARTIENALQEIMAGQLGAVAHESGHLERARTGYERAISFLSEAGEVRYQGLFMAALGALSATQDRVEEARQLIDRAGQLAALLDDPGADAVTWLCAGHLDLAHARAARAAGDDEAADAMLLQAQTRLESATAEETPSEEARIAERMLKRALHEYGASSRATASRERTPADLEGSLLVAAHGRAFRAPGGSRIDLGRRKAVCRVLLRLVLERHEQSEQPMSAEVLFEAGWPDRKPNPTLATKRVTTAITALEELGLGRIIEHNADGWRLSPGLEVRVVPDLD